MAQDLKQEVVRRLKGRPRSEIVSLADEIEGVSFSMLYQLALGVYKSEPGYKKLASIKRRLDQRAA